MVHRRSLVADAGHAELTLTLIPALRTQRLLLLFSSFPRLPPSALHLRVLPDLVSFPVSAEPPQDLSQTSPPIESSQPSSTRAFRPNPAPEASGVVLPDPVSPGPPISLVEEIFLAYEPCSGPGRILSCRHRNATAAKAEVRGGRQLRNDGMSVPQHCSVL